MDIRHFRYFDTLAREGSFSRAAERLRIAQPALSKQIRDLEIDLGGKLFDRTTRRVELTPFGRMLLPQVQQTLAQFSHARIIAGDYVAGRSGTVRIGMTGNAMLSEKVTSALQHFRAHHPNAVLEMTEQIASKQIEAILGRELDVGLQPALGFEVDSRLQTRKVDSWPWVMAMGSQHRLADQATIRFADLDGENFIMYAADQGGRNASSVLRDLAGHSPRIAFASDNTMTVLAMVAIGLGIAPLPQILSLLRHPGVRYVPIADPLPASDLLVVSRVGDTFGPAKKLIDAISP